MKVKVLSMAELREELQCQNDIGTFAVDECVLEQYPALFETLDRVCSVRAGEAHKNMESLFRLTETLLSFGTGRKDPLIAVGGGITGDMVGFTASIYKRGVPFINVPTTFLSMLDSCIGGKTAVNFHGYKNVLGTFYDAKEVLIAPEFLKTLSEREIINGIGELVKYTFLSDRITLFEVNSLLPRILKKELSVLENFIRRAVEVKISFIEADYKESGTRKILNFGHTIGHAIESLFKYSKYNHGEAVMIGIYYELVLSHILKGLPAETVEDYADFLKQILEIPKFDMNEGREILEYIKNDKKNGLSGMTLPLFLGGTKFELAEDVQEEAIFNAVVSY